MPALSAWTFGRHNREGNRVPRKRFISERNANSGGRIAGRADFGDAESGNAATSAAKLRR